MGASKELFTQMREIEALELSATKKNCIEKGRLFIKNALESGFVSKQELMAKILRYENFILSAKDVLKTEFNEKDEFFGISITPVNGRKMPQYSEDKTYSDIAKQLKQREELLAVALKSDEPIYDNEGVEVPKISVKYSKNSIQIKF